MLLIPALAAGAQTSPDGRARIVNTGSVGSYMVDKIVWESLKGESPKRKAMGRQLYDQSKFVRKVYPHRIG